MKDEPVQRIARPRQLYVGPPRREYVPVEQR
jgi:citrate synthase